MAISKAQQFNEQQIRLARFAKALSHPARVAILEHLFERNACVCGDIVEALPLSQSTVSQHLKELKAAGLIQGTIDGPKVCYCINPSAWNEVGELLNAFFNRPNSSAKNEACC